MIVYIACPYTVGDTAMNVAKGIKAANELAERGYTPLLPILNHFWHIAFPHPYDFWLKMDLEILPRCDAVLRVKGESSGADIEVAYAEERAIPVFFDIDDLDDWAATRK